MSRIVRRFAIAAAVVVGLPAAQEVTGYVLSEDQEVITHGPWSSETISNRVVGDVNVPSCALVSQGLFMETYDCKEGGGRGVEPGSEGRGGLVLFIPGLYPATYGPRQAGS